MKMNRIGPHLAKNLVEIYGLDESEHEVLRNTLLEIFANGHTAWWGLEACTAPTTGLASRGNKVICRV